MNPSLGPVAAVGIEVRVDRSTTLPGRVWCAERPRALIAIVHGLGEHAGRYAALASDLVTRTRCTVVALDLPGHGDAPGSRGDIPSWNLVRDQVVPSMFTATRGLPDQPYDLPHVLMGHSMGGVIALDHALAHPRGVHALVLSAPALVSTMPPWWKLALANVALATAPSTGFANGLDLSGLSRDPDVRRLYDDDPRVHGKISPRLYFALNEARQRCMREARSLQVPTLLLQGMSDRMVDPKGALELAGAATHGIVRFETLADRYHEIFNDVGRDDVVALLAAWLDAVLVV
jgi:alpha-beta hydrolase superfamily lysophospholipase